MTITLFQLLVRVAKLYLKHGNLPVYYYCDQSRKLYPIKPEELNSSVDPYSLFGVDVHDNERVLRINGN